MGTGETVDERRRGKGRWVQAGAGVTAGAEDVYVAGADGRALRRGNQRVGRTLRRVSGRTRDGWRGGKAGEWGIGSVIRCSTVRAVRARVREKRRDKGRCVQVRTGGGARRGVGAPGRLQRRDAGAELLIACIALDYCTVSVYNYIRLRHEYILIRRRNCQNEEFFGYDDRTNSASDAS